LPLARNLITSSQLPACCCFCWLLLAMRGGGRTQGGLPRLSFSAAGTEVATEPARFGGAGRLTGPQVLGMVARRASIGKN